MSSSPPEGRDVVAKDGSAVYVEVYRAEFKDVGRTGSEYTGRHEFHYKTAEGFGIKFHLGQDVDERLLRDVARTAIQRWLGTPPTIEQASKVTDWMYGRWESQKPTLISPGQFLDCLADAIRQSEIAVSELKLLANAEKLMSERTGTEPQTDVDRLSAAIAELRRAIDAKNLDVIRLRTSELEEAMKPIRVARRKEQSIPLLAATLEVRQTRTLFYQGRSAKIILENSGGDVENLFVTANVKGASKEFGPFSVAGKQQISIDLSGYEGNEMIEELLFELSCTDVIGNTYRTGARALHRDVREILALSQPS